MCIRDSRQRLVLLLDLEALLGLDGLMEALAPDAAVHEAARELVDDDDLVLLDDIVHIALVDLLGPQGLLDVVGPLLSLIHISEPTRPY